MIKSNVHNQVYKLHMEVWHQACKQKAYIELRKKLSTLFNITTRLYEGLVNLYRGTCSSTDVFRNKRKSKMIKSDVKKLVRLPNSLEVHNAFKAIEEKTYMYALDNIHHKILWRTNEVDNNIESGLVNEQEI